MDGLRVVWLRSDTKLASFFDKSKVYAYKLWKNQLILWFSHHYLILLSNFKELSATHIRLDIYENYPVRISAISRWFLDELPSNNHFLR
jgi:hypothetical protein